MFKKNCSKCNNCSDGKPKEECGVFGIYGAPKSANMTYLGLYSLQHRGQESAGIASSDGEIIYRHAGMGKVVEVFNENDLDKLEGNMSIGHVRYSTTGDSYLKNAQPLRVDSRLGPIVLSHNGNLANTNKLHDDLVEKGHLFQTTIDSEVVVHLMASSGINDFQEAFIDAVKQIEGAFSLLVMNKDTIYATRDPQGFRPLVLGKLDDAWVIASESCAFDIIDAEYVREVEPGELIKIDKNGLTSSFPFEKREQKLCIFEFIYFSRPDSTIFNHSVHEMRLKLGRMLSKELPVEADVVVPIPDSSVSAALGYAQESGIPYEMGMIRSHYIGRTFIEPTQKIRDFGAKIKYNVIKSVVKDKRIVVVDDSIMRGTTMRKIINMFKKAGAKEVHVRISAPPTKFPCYYGIDIPTVKELIAANNSIEEIRKYLNVDTLAYLTKESLIESVDTPDMSYCTSCFDGIYPIKYEESKDKKFKFENTHKDFSDQ